MAAFIPPVPATPRAQALNPLPSARSATFVNQTLNGLSPAPGMTGAGPMPTAPALTALAARAAGQKGNTVSIANRVREGNAKLAAITNAAAQKRATTALPTQQGQIGAYKGATTGFTGQKMNVGKGNVGIKDVVQVSNGQYLRKDAGSAFIQLANAYKQATGKSLGLTEGWRSNQRQAQLYALYKSGKGNLAAKPGTSIHERGTAADWNGMGSVGSPQFKWLQQNAGKFGWKWTGGSFSQIEPWHWEFG